jgi:hypothetical protein
MERFLIRWTERADDERVDFMCGGELTFHLSCKRMRKPNGIFGHHQPRDADGADAGRTRDAAQRGEFTIDQPRPRMGRLVEGLDDLAVRIQPKSNDRLALVIARQARDLVAV